MNTDTMPKKVHMGRNVQRFRNMLNIKQEALAFELDMTQQNLSVIEQKEVIEDKVLEKIAEILKIPVEAFKNFTEEVAFNIVANTFTDFKDNAIASAMNYSCSFNPIDKIVESYNEKVVLFERMLKSEQEKNAFFEKLLSEKK